MITSTYSNKQNAIARFATTSIASLLVSGAMILTTGCSDDSSSPAGAATDTTYSDDSEAMYFEMGDGTYELNITGEGVDLVQGIGQMAAGRVIVLGRLTADTTAISMKSHRAVP